METEIKLSMEQLLAVRSAVPVTLVTAAPGSGKTRTLVARVKMLIQNGVDPARICCVTFTNAGAKEIQTRLDGVRLGHIGTLHSLMLRLLRYNGQKVGLGSVQVIDEEVANEELRIIMEFFKCKESIKTVTAMLKQKTATRRPGGLVTKEDLAVKQYRANMVKTGNLDYDSVLVYGLKLIQAMDGLIGIDHLLVDEIQDSAEIDGLIYNELKVPFKFFVGDLDQAIYGFRGGDVRFIEKLKEDSITNPEVAHCRLGTNYRSCKEIIATAARIGSSDRHNACDNAEAGEVYFNKFDSSPKELGWVTGMASIKPAGRTMAILWRTNAQAAACTKTLNDLGVSVVKNSKYEKKSVATEEALVVASFIQEPHRDFNVLRLLKFTKGEEAANNIKLKAAAIMQLAGDVAYNGIEKPNIYETNLSATHFVATMKHFQPLFQWSSDAQNELEKAAQQMTESFTISDIITELRHGNRERETVQEFEGGIYVGTVHSAKGLEWDAVFLCGLEADQWPGRDKLEESRRLLYVGITRAKKQLWMSWSASRPNPFKPWIMETKEPSPFFTQVSNNKA